MGRLQVYLQQANISEILQLVKELGKYGSAWNFMKCIHNHTFTNFQKIYDYLLAQYFNLFYRKDISGHSGLCNAVVQIPNGMNY